MSTKKETNQEHFARHPQESGNALIYVLIAIALFAALNFVMSRQTDTGESGALAQEKVELLATQLISGAAQAKSAVDQMLFSGTKINQLNFELPTDPAFETGSAIHKVYHPQGGGLTPLRLSAEATAQSSTNPPAGWYMGRFNNVDWTASSGQDVFLVAHQIREDVCAAINKKITGSETIPALTDPIANVMIDDDFHTGTNEDLTTGASDICPDCAQKASLCVQNAAGDAFAFYILLADQ